MIPKDVAQQYGGVRGYKKAKRAELRAVLAALEKLSLGCAYMPEYQKLIVARRALREVAAECSAKKWGR